MYFFFRAIRHLISVIFLHCNQHLCLSSRPTDCDIVEIPKEYQKAPSSYVLLQKDSPYRELFNYYIIRLKEGDLQHRPYKTYFPSYEGDVCPGLVGKPLGLKNCISAFLFLGIGIVGAILILIGEIIKEKMLAKKSSRQITKNQPTANHTSPELALVDVSI